MSRRNPKWLCNHCLDFPKAERYQSGFSTLVGLHIKEHCICCSETSTSSDEESSSSATSPSGEAPNLPDAREGWGVKDY